jgi:protein MpaA
MHQRISRAAAVKGFRGERFGAVGDDDLWIWSRLGSKPDAPVVFLSSGIHGDERSGPEAVVGLMEEGSWDERFNWVVLPILNPSGLRRESRENAAGIDLNRDFLRRMAGETIALIDWWRGRPKPCSLHFSFHEDWEAEGFYLYEISTGAGPSLAPSILNAVGGEFPLQSDGPVDDHALAAPGWIIHAPEPDEPEGWPEAIWLSRTWPMRSYTFEAPGRQCLDRRIACLKAAGKAALGLIPSAF